MEERVLTAATAIIKKDGVAIGQMRNIRCTENIRRAEVQGIGNLGMVELPATAISCSFTCGFYAIDMKRGGIPGLEARNVQSPKEYYNNIALGSSPVDLYIYKKTAKVSGGSLIVKDYEEKEFAIIRGLVLESTSFNISEGQISGHDQSGRYLDPIISPE